MAGTYKPPAILREWTLDIERGELYQLIVFDNFTECGAYGRYSHSSGSATSSWLEFLAGALDDVVIKTMGPRVLSEARAFVEEASAHQP